MHSPPPSSFNSTQSLITPTRFLVFVKERIPTNLILLSINFPNNPNLFNNFLMYNKNNRIFDLSSYKQVIA